jgi:hypothetical protein
MYMKLMKSPSQTPLKILLKTGTHASQTHLWQLSIRHLFRCVFINQKPVEFNEIVPKTRLGRDNAFSVATNYWMGSPGSESL